VHKLLALGALVGRDDGGAAQADVVLKGGVDTVDLALVGGAAQLPGQLRALGQTRRTERVPLGDEPTRRVDHPASAVGGVVVVDQSRCFTLAAQAEGFVQQKLVGGEAVVQLDDLEVLGAEARLVVNLLGHSCRSR
jgi:hypothetical protein